MKFFHSGFLLLCLFLFSNTSIISQTLKDPKDSLPASIEGWNSGTDRYFDNETLYNYIDGGAELFLSFGFSKVFNRIYGDGKNNEIFVDIFYMNKPEDAYGAFLFTSGKVDEQYGSQSQVSPGAVIFWKMNYYISLTSNRETEEGNKVIADLASIIDKAIVGKTPFPKIIDYLPQENLDKESIRYFRHYIWLNTHFFLSNDDILNINQQTEAVTAKYGSGESKTVLILIEYPDDESTAEAFNKFKSNFYNAYLASDSYKNSGRYSHAVMTGRFIAAVFNGVSPSQTSGLAEQALVKTVKRNNK